jgi:2-polyprenyl-3-methyl-5-hydroxy-6-metoxy-1,4-benzoquinol methylase
MVDEGKLQAFMGQIVVEAGAINNAPLIVLGERLGLYKAMAGAGPLTPAELAARTHTDERYIREWLSAQAAGGFVTYDPAMGAFTLPPEQAVALADEDSPFFVAGMFGVARSMFLNIEKIENAFRTGGGFGWHEHHECLFHSVARFFRAAYIGHLFTDWLPALDGVTDKLRRGAKVADIACGHGESTILMAKEFPNSRFFGFDYHEASIVAARRRAEEEGVSDRVSFEAASAKAYPGRDYDLVATFDALHDMGDPVGAAEYVRTTLAPEGTWMIVEPRAGDRLEDNLNPVGRIYYTASTFVCTPASKAQEVGLALGAQAGKKRLEEVVRAGGFTRFRLATETPFQIVLEARP